MMGLFMDKPREDLPLRELCGEILHTDAIFGFQALQFCDDSGGGLRRYNVYKVAVNGQEQVLKRSERREIDVYRSYLAGRGFHVPEFYGYAMYDGHPWILLEYVAGPDLRDFTDGIALAAADSVTAVMNAYWESGQEDGRFETYWERIGQRAQCLAGEPEIRKAYEQFLERQRSCPRTLCSGDFLQFNAIDRGGEVFMIDWAFGGIMPYSLDVARMIAHGSEDRRAFPFYMTDRHRELYVQAVYEKLVRKPDWQRYLLDVRLAVLNEFVEFIEWELNHPSEERDQVFDFYYSRAKALARELNA